jgi:hypothetical protein
MESHWIATKTPNELQTTVCIKKIIYFDISHSYLSHGLFHPLVLYSYTKTGIKVTYPSAAVWLYYFVLQVKRSPIYDTPLLLEGSQASQHFIGEMTPEKTHVQGAKAVSVPLYLPQTPCSTVSLDLARTSHIAQLMLHCVFGLITTAKHIKVSSSRMEAGGGVDIRTGVKIGEWVPQRVCTWWYQCCRQSKHCAQTHIPQLWNTDLDQERGRTKPATDAGQLETS